MPRTTDYERLRADRLSLKKLLQFDTVYERIDSLGIQAPFVGKVALVSEMGTDVFWVTHPNRYNEVGLLVATLDVPPVPDAKPVVTSARWCQGVTEAESINSPDPGPAVIDAISTSPYCTFIDTVEQLAQVFPPAEIVPVEV